MAVILLCDNFIREAACGSLQYSHGPLISALNDHLNEFGTPASSSSVIGGTGKGVTGIVNAGSSVGGNSAGGSVGGNVNSAAAEALQGNSINGGEVLATKTFPISSQEPTCEQLRAMWIFSKRQSRAAEITNEIPTYRDPFAYNVWEPYYSTTRSLGALRMVPRFGERSRSPVFGRVVSREPIIPQRFTTGLRQRHFGGESGRMLGGGSGHIYGAAETKLNTINSMAVASAQRRSSQYRYVGANGSTMNGGGGGSGGNSNSVQPVQGSFKKLKELIWTERAKELTQQRRSEELAARAAVFKEIANGQNIQSFNKNAFKSDSLLMDENRSPDSDSYQYMNDGRMSIASGQTLSSQSTNSNSKNKNNNSGGSDKTALHSYMNKGHDHGHNLHKSKIFSGNTGSNRSARLLLPSTIASSYTMDDSHERGRGSISGISKAYPISPSHFRERNRSLFKEFMEIVMEKTNDEFHAVLSKLKGEIFYDLFMEHGITTESLKYLTSSQMSEIVPKNLFGQRIIFEHNLFNWQRAERVESQLSTSQTGSTASISSSFFNAIDGLLRAAYTGATILNFYENNKKLNPYYRKNLAGLIAEYLLKEKIHATPQTFNYLSNQILEFFPTECKSSPAEYFQRDLRQNSNNLHDSSIADDSKDINTLENIIKNFNLPSNKYNNKQQQQIFTGTERKFLTSNNNLLMDSDDIATYDDHNILDNDNDMLFTDVSGVVNDDNIDDVIHYNEDDLLETESQPEQHLIGELLEYNNYYSY